MTIWDPRLVEVGGYLRGMGNRYIIRFATQIKNVGDADFYIGKAPDDPSEPSTQFVYDPCHHHWHYMGYAEYILYDAEEESDRHRLQNRFLCF